MPNPLIIGAGPAGLTAAYELCKAGLKPLVLEQDSLVGGIARTEVYQGYRYDIGGHRFYTKVNEVEELWHEVMPENFQKRPRLSRIYYNHKYFNYPLKLSNTLGNLGLMESARILASYLWAQLNPAKEEETFDQWVSNRFGQRLYQTFFKTYTEKVWGIPCAQIRAEWAAQRIKGLSLRTAVLSAIFGNIQNTKTLIEEFEYPTQGPGMMWEAFQAKVEERGGQVQLNRSVVSLKHDGKRITSVTIKHGKKSTEPATVAEVATDYVISSMPIATLIRQLDPPAPLAVQQAARGLKYRDFLIVGLIVNSQASFPDNWIYIHEPNIKVGRIQNFRNWSAEMVPDSTMTSLGMEYFCNETDPLWAMADTDLIALAGQELELLGLGKAADVVDGHVIRQRKAYPVYDGEYRQHLDVLRNYLAGFVNLQTIGRNGMHRYNNQDHSMLTGILAARNILGEEHDLWEVNTERSYYEEFTTAEKQQPLPLRKIAEAQQLLPAAVLAATLI